MPDPEDVSADDDRELGARNLVRMVGLFAFTGGLGLVIVSAADLVLAVAGNDQVRYDWMFFLGLLVLVVGWWFLLAGYGREEGRTYVDCPSCGSINEVSDGICPTCGAPVD